MTSIGIHMTFNRARSIGKLSRSSPLIRSVDKPRFARALIYAVSSRCPEKSVEAVPPSANGRYMTATC